GLAAVYGRPAGDRPALSLQTPTIRDEWIRQRRPRVQRYNPSFDRILPQFEGHRIFVPHAPERFTSSLEEREKRVLDVTRDLDPLQEVEQGIGSKAILLALGIEGYDEFHGRPTWVKQGDEGLALLGLLLQAIVPYRATFFPNRKGAEEQGFRSSAF